LSTTEQWQPPLHQRPGCRGRLPTFRVSRRAPHKPIHHHQLTKEGRSAPPMLSSTPQRLMTTTTTTILPSLECKPPPLATPTSPPNNCQPLFGVMTVQVCDEAASFFRGLLATELGARRQGQLSAGSMSRWCVCARMTRSRCAQMQATRTTHCVIALVRHPCTHACWPCDPSAVALRGPIVRLHALVLCLCLDSSTHRACLCVIAQTLPQAQITLEGHSSHQILSGRVHHPTTTALSPSPTLQ